MKSKLDQFIPHFPDCSRLQASNILYLKIALSLTFCISNCTSSMLSFIVNKEKAVVSQGKLQSTAAHHQHGSWLAWIGRVARNKDLYLGTFSTQEKAAEAYDVAVIKFRGANAVTNFDISRYDVERIMANKHLLSAFRNCFEIVPILYF